MPYPIKLEECTWTEICAAIRDGRDTVIIPTASIEQHGPHLPLITGSLISEALAVRVAEKLDDAFAAPVIRPGSSGQQMAFPGSLAFSSVTFLHVLEDICLTLAEHGFRSLVLISTHSGSYSAIQQAAGVIQEHIWEKGLTSSVIPCADPEQYTRLQQDYLVSEYGEQPEAAAGYAALVETAVMLALRPDLVHMERVEAGWMGGPFSVRQQIFGEGPQTLAGGVPGDPLDATPEMGEKLLEFLSQEMARDIRAQILCRR